jgi:hypothetical protein
MLTRARGEAMLRQIPRHCITALLLAVIGRCGGDPDTSVAHTPLDRGGARDTQRDACAIVSQADATALFGQPAVRQEGDQYRPPGMIGECLWTWDTDTDNHLLQFRIWDTDQGYGQPDDEFTQPLDIGARGYVRSHPGAGVDVEWVQHNRTIALSYSKVGSNVADPRTKADAVEALARRIAAQL